MGLKVPGVLARPQPRLRSREKNAISPSYGFLEKFCLVTGNGGFWGMLPLDCFSPWERGSVSSPLLKKNTEKKCTATGFFQSHFAFPLLRKWLSQGYRFFEQCFKFFAFLIPYVKVIIRAQEAGFEFAVGSYPQAVAECAELRIVERADNFNLGTIEAVLFPVVHPSRNDLF